MNQPHFTILIPTRERCETLRATLETCVGQDYDNCSIVVCDNFSGDATRDVVASFGDPRVRHVRTERRLSMSGNFEFSLSFVPEGSYLIHIGDDDALIPGALSYLADLLRETKAEAIVSNPATYFWPNAVDTTRRNLMVLPTTRGFEWRNARKSVEEAANFRLPYLHLPGTYYSVASRAVIDRARVDGRYYASITPDCFSSFINAGHLDRFVFSKRPFSLAGISGRSNGASHFNVTKASTEASFYEAENDLPTHKDIVQCSASIQIFIAEAFLQARDRAAELRGVPFSFERLAHVALREAVPGSYSVVREAIMEIFAKHGIAASVPERPTLFMRGENTFLRQRHRAALVLSGVRRIDCARSGITDVAGAARLAGALLNR